MDPATGRSRSGKAPSRPQPLNLPAPAALSPLPSPSQMPPLRSPNTGHMGRGFGFVTFERPKSVEDVLASCPHTLDGRTVSAPVVRLAASQPIRVPPLWQIDPKRAVPRSGGEPAALRVRKIFVGGLSADVREEDLHNYFSQFGQVNDDTRAAFAVPWGLTRPRALRHACRLRTCSCSVTGRRNARVALALLPFSLRRKPNAHCRNSTTRSWAATSR